MNMEGEIENREKQMLLSQVSTFCAQSYVGITGEGNFLVEMPVLTGLHANCIQTREQGPPSAC